MKHLVTWLAICCLLPTAPYAWAMEVPLQLQHPGWQQLNYKRIPANRVNQLEGAIEIHIQQSASPLIYLFEQPVDLSKIRVSGQMGALPVIPLGLVQGEPGADDFALRLGLVLEGEKRLNFAQRLIAAPWVRSLFELAPADTGIDQILFLNLANPGKLEWRQREHPAGQGLYTEYILKQVEAYQPFELEHELAMPERVLALWISADGDDTGSAYTLSIESIHYE